MSEQTHICIGWFCTWRDKCAMYAENQYLACAERVRWFLPKYPAEHCPDYKEVKNAESGDG